MADVKAGFDILSRAVNESLTMIDRVNDLGAASLRAKTSLDLLSGGHAPQYLREMNDATRGLVPDMTLAQQAVKALTLHLVENEQQAGALARAGAILGNTMGIGATQGVETLTLAMSRVGLVGLLDNIGLSGAEVKKRFQELKETMGDQQAWSTAVLENAATRTKMLESSLDGVGTSVDRLKAGFSTWSAGVAENVATSIEYLLRFGQVIDDLAGKTDLFRKTAPGQGLSTNVPPIAAANAPGIMLATGDINDPLGLKGVTKPAMPWWSQLSQGVSAGATPGMTDFERSARMSARGIATGGEQDPSIAGWLAEAKRYDETLRGSNANWREAVGLSATVAANTAAAAEHTKSVGIIKGMVSGQGGQLSTDIQTVRTAREAEDRRKGMGKGAIEKDLAVFDRQAQLAMDSYALATGAATKESLAFRDAQKELSKEFTTGKITVGEYSRGMAELAANAASGKTSLLEMEKTQAKLMSVAAANETDKFGRKAGRKGVASLGLAEAAGGGGYGAGEVGSTESTLDPYAPLIKSAEKYSQASDQATQHSATFLSAISQHSQLAANSMQPLNSKALEVGRNVQAISKQLYGLSGDLTVHIGFSVTGGGGGKGAASM